MAIVMIQTYYVDSIGDPVMSPLSTCQTQSMTGLNKDGSGTAHLILELSSKYQSRDNFNTFAQSFK